MTPTYFKATHRVSILIICIYTLFCLPSQTNATLQERIVHIPVHSSLEGQDIEFEAKLEGSFARVVYMRIYFKNPEEESFRYVEMRQEVDHWVGHIPGRSISGPTINYFLVALMDNQTVLTYPEFNPYNNPEELTITPRPAEAPVTTPAMEIPGQQPLEPLQSLEVADEASLPEFDVKEEEVTTDLLLLSPEDGEKLVVEDLVVAISLIGSERVIDSSSVSISLDGRDVTAYAEISAVLVTLTPARLLSGRHWIKVTAKDSSGNSVSPLMSHFVILGEEDKSRVESRFNGRAFADLRSEKFSGKSRSTNFAGIDFTGKYGILDYSGRVYLSSLEKKDRQPINRFTLNLQTQALGLRIGDTNPRFNDLILWGKRVRGLEGYIHLGFINVDIVYGESYRAVEGLTTTTMDSVFNPATGLNDSTVTSTAVSRYGTFRQTLLGIRPSFGSGRHFQFGLSLLKIKDDTSSIKIGYKPKDNLVIGPDLLISFDRRRFELRASGAISALTNDISSGSISKDDLKENYNIDEEVPVEPADFEKYLIINESTIPLDPTKMTSSAYNISLRLNYYHNFLRVGYKSIGSAYNSLANSFIRKNIQGVYFSDRIRLFKNQLYFTISYEDLVDNFIQDDNNPATNLKSFNYALSFYPGQVWPRVNISLRTRYRDNGIATIAADTMMIGTADSVIYHDRRENTLNRDFSAQLSQDFLLFDAQHTISLNYVNSDRIDRYDASRLPDAYSQEVSTDVRMASLRSAFQIPLVSTIQYASNANIAAGGDSDFKYNMVALTAEYLLFNQKLTTYGEFRITAASGKTVSNDKIDYARNSFRFGCIYKFTPVHSLSFDAYIIGLKDDGVSASGVSNESFTDTVFRLRYDQRF